jgi:nucleoside-diphosphate-sugar epimerase
MTKKIALVGGCGFIGHNLAISLKKKGFNPIIIDSLSINNLKSIDRDFDSNNKELYRSILNERLNLLKKNEIELIIKDSKYNILLQEELKNIRPDKIIHLAAVSHANKSNKDPHTTFENSMRTLENSLDYAKNEKIHLIYLSSSMVYGNFNSKNVDENTNCNPIGIYGTLKYCGELLVKSFNHVFDLPYTIIRPSALYGERCVSRRVTQIFVENALTKKSLKIMGTGEEKLDFTYVQDLINGIISCVENENAKNQIFNLTYGNARKISEVINIMHGYFPNLEIENIERDKFMPERGTLDISKAKKFLNYNPSFDLEKGFKKYIEWYIDFYKNLKQR